MGKNDIYLLPIISASTGTSWTSLTKVRGVLGHPIQSAALAV
jgi:hypothetical protein